MFSLRAHLGHPADFPGRLWLLGLLWGALLLHTLPALAREGFHFGGFGTIGITGDNRNDLAGMRDISQHFLYSKGTTALVDSRLGLQLEYGISPYLQLLGQMVIRDHFRANAANSTELAYLAITPIPSLEIRLGRINYDAFLMTDHRNVGYAYPWVRPPTDFYGWIPIMSIDGIDTTLSINDKGVLWKAKAQTGSSNFFIPFAGGRDGGYHFQTNNLSGFSLARETEGLTLKAAYSQFSIATEVPIMAPLRDGLDQVSAAGIPGVSAEARDLRHNIAFQGADIRYLTLGASYDFSDWAIQSEIGRTTSTATVIPLGDMGYLSVGRRFGDWLPFVKLGRYRRRDSLRAASNNWGETLNTPLRDRAISILNNTQIDQKSAALGVRWDFQPGAACKLQWERTFINSFGYGLWWSAPANYPHDGQIDQFSITVDFIF